MLNALAAIAVATELEIDDAAIQRALAGFQGIDRRLQVLGDVEIGARPRHAGRRLRPPPDRDRGDARGCAPGLAGPPHVLVFEPHRYTRTRDLLDDFAQVLSTADALVVAEVYPAGEAPIPGADGKALCRAIRSRGAVEPVLLKSLDELPQVLAGIARDGDVVLTMGAGSIGAAAHDLPAALQRRDRHGRCRMSRARAASPTRASSAASPCCSAARRRSARCRSTRAATCSRRCCARASTRTPVDGIPALVAGAHRCRRAPLRPRVQHPARQPRRRRGRRAAGPARRARRAVHRLGRARLGAVDGQDPHQAGVAVARPADAGVREPRARRRRARRRRARSACR